FLQAWISRKVHFRFSIWSASPEKAFLIFKSIPYFLFLSHKFLKGQEVGGVLPACNIRAKVYNKTIYKLKAVVTMCGIAGFTGNREEKAVILKKMTDAILHRGPDGEGHFLDEGIALGH